MNKLCLNHDCSSFVLELTGIVPLAPFSVPVTISIFSITRWYISGWYLLTAFRQTLLLKQISLPTSKRWNFTRPSYRKNSSLSSQDSFAWSTPFRNHTYTLSPNSITC